MTDAENPNPTMPEAPERDDDRPLDPEKLLRLASLVRAVLEETREMDPDEHTTAELAALHSRVTTQLYQALPNELVKELEEIDPDMPFDTGGARGREVRIAYAALIGWLGGLFQGLQAAAQMSHMESLQQQQARAALERRKEEQERRGPGQYL